MGILTIQKKEELFIENTEIHIYQKEFDSLVRLL